MNLNGSTANGCGGAARKWKVVSPVTSPKRWLPLELGDYPLLLYVLHYDTNRLPLYAIQAETINMKDHTYS